MSKPKEANLRLFLHQYFLPKATILSAIKEYSLWSHIRQIYVGSLALAHDLHHLAAGEFGLAVFQGLQGGFCKRQRDFYHMFERLLRD